MSLLLHLGAGTLMARILSVSYDISLLESRRLILESIGHEVVSALSFFEALKACQSQKDFDLFILGHSISREDKEALVSAFRAHCPGIVVALKRPGEAPVQGADFEIEPAPDGIVNVITQIVSRKKAATD